MTFGEIRAKCPVQTLVDDKRQKLIHRLVKLTKPLGGYMAEIGVYKGGTSWLIANTDSSRRLYSCDSFEGLPKPSSVDTHKKGDFDDTSYEEVKKLLDPYNVVVLKSFFPHPDINKEMYVGKYSFVHIDVDLYQSTVECLEFFWPRMIKGGIIVIDDYRMETCPGVDKAVDDYISYIPPGAVEVGLGSKSIYLRKL